MFGKKKENLNSFAVDFGAHTIKVVRLKDVDKNPALVTFGSIETPYGVLGSENEDHKRTLAESLKSLVHDLGIQTTNASISLPDSSIFSKVIRIPAQKEADLEEAVFWATKKNIPISPDEVQVDWSIVNKLETSSDGVTQYDVLLVAAPKLLINRYVDILKLAGFTPVLIETESLSLVRSLSYKNDTSPSLIMDFGYNGIETVVAYKETLLFPQTIAIGSSVLTKAIAQGFNLEEVQAEEYKKSYGLDPAQLEGKIYRTLLPIMESIVNEIRRTFNAYKATNISDTPTKIILVGNGSMLPGLVLYLAQNLNMEVEVGNPYSKIYMDPGLKNKLPAPLPGYAVALGLALKV